MPRDHQGLATITVLSMLVGVIMTLSVSFGNASAVYAQSQVLSGRYSIIDAGFEIMIPDGWTGTQVDRTRAVFSPAGSAASSEVFMTVLAADRRDTKELVTSKIDVTSGRAAVSSPGCESLKGEIVSLNANKVFHMVHECSGSDSYRKTDTYVIFTLAKTVAISLSASSADAYDRHVATFVDSMQTSRVNNPINFRAALEVIFGTTGIFTRSVNLEAADSQVGLVAATSSRITSMNFDEESTRIVVVLNEIRRPEGNLLIPVGELLRGPYQVYVNGELHNDFLVITDGDTGEQLVNVRYSQGMREIEIFGTEVVPEFNIAIAGVLAATLSAVVLHQRGAFQGRL